MQPNQPNQPNRSNQDLELRSAAATHEQMFQQSNHTREMDFATKSRFNDIVRQIRSIVTLEASLTMKKATLTQSIGKYVAAFGHHDHIGIGYLPTILTKCTGMDRRRLSRMLEASRELEDNDDDNDKA